MSASGVFGPAPAGIDLTETRNRSISSAVISLMVIGTIFVCLRVIARSLQKGISLAVDDYCIILGLQYALSLVGLPYGAGKHLWVLTATEFTTIWQILFAYVIIYACAVTLTKLSIILFYRRIFGMTYGLWACFFLVISYWITVCVTILVSCRPLDAFWNRYTTRNSTSQCINVPVFFLANGIWAMLVDIFILVVPIPIVLKLQLPKRQKSLVLLIFLLGSFVCIASIIRIFTIHTVIKSQDLTWAMGQLFIWSCCEPFIGIVCACLPTLAPFFRRWWTVVRTRQGSSSNPASADPNASPSGRTSRARASKKNSDTVLSSTSTVQVDLRIPKTNKDWSRLQGDSQIKLRYDDEMELTTDISGPDTNLKVKDSDEELGVIPQSDIRVQRDVSWSEAHLAESRHR